MKRKILIIAILIICLAGLTGGTIAYFTAEDTATNVITAGNLSIELVETALDAEGETVPFRDVVGVVPGSQVSKIVRVKNTGDAAAYVRVHVETVIYLAEGKDGQVDLSLVTVDINTESWTEKDGYYYCNTVVQPGELTPPLFTKVSFDAGMDNRYTESTVKLIVHAQATQWKNNGQSALEASGWPEA